MMWLLESSVTAVCNHTHVHTDYVWEPFLEVGDIGSYSGELGGIRNEQVTCFSFYTLFFESSKENLHYHFINK